MSKPPKGSAAMKAVLTDERFSDPDWIYERKLDGIRCIAVRDGGKVKLWSRNDLSLNDRWPELAEALEKQPKERFAIDGEVVALEHGQTRFGSLGKGKNIYLYVFDVLWLDGEDVRKQPLRERKRLLKDAIEFQDPVRWTAHRNEKGEAMYEEACRKGWEGVIAKRADSPYATSRSKDWLKFKCEMGQELVVGGYTAPRGSRTDLGALLVGYYDGNKNLHYAGKVGTGFDRDTLRDLRQKLEPLKRDTAPFDEVKAFKNVTWVEPRLVAQIGFSEWTGYGRLRHPRFLGLRIDKPASQVVREG